MLENFSCVKLAFQVKVRFLKVEGQNRGKVWEKVQNRKGKSVFRIYWPSSWCGMKPIEIRLKLMWVQVRHWEELTIFFRLAYKVPDFIMEFHSSRSYNSNFLLSFLKNLYIDLQRDYTNFHSYEKWVSILFFSTCSPAHSKKNCN